MTFVGFKGLDSCKRRSVAISNERAGVGEELQPSTRLPGSIFQRYFPTHFGSAKCIPIISKNLLFIHTPPEGRLRFSDSSNALGAPSENGFAKCFIQDTDGSLLNQGANRLGGAREWSFSVFSLSPFR